MWWVPCTQPCGLGCDVAAPLALNRTAVGVKHKLLLNNNKRNRDTSGEIRPVQLDQPHPAKSDPSSSICRYRLGIFMG